MESPSGSVTGWIDRLKTGDADALQPLWDRYFVRLAEIAQTRARSSRSATSASDGEDVALSAIDALQRGLLGGGYRELNDREDLWRLLLHIVRGKLIDRHRHENRERRGGGRVVRESDMADPAEMGGGGSPLDQFAGQVPCPEEKAILGEEFHRRLEQLDATGVSDLRQVAELKLLDRTNAEIAAELRYSLRTIVLRVALIREIWNDGEAQS